MMRSLEIGGGESGDLDFGGLCWLRNGDRSGEILLDRVEQLLVCLGTACDMLEPVGSARDFEAAE